MGPSLGLCALLLAAALGSSAASAAEPTAAIDSWFQCPLTCGDPSLCAPLNPQPPPRFEVVAPLVGGPRDLDAYGANGSEWNLWLSEAVSQSKVTTVASMNSISGGFSSGLQAGLLCEAHRQGVRVVDWDTVSNLHEPFAFVNFPERILNATAMRNQLWASLRCHLKRQSQSKRAQGYIHDYSCCWFSKQDVCV
jgi:hypothetical protein